MPIDLVQKVDELPPRESVFGGISHEVPEAATYYTNKSPALRLLRNSVAMLRGDQIRDRHDLCLDAGTQAIGTGCLPESSEQPLDARKLRLRDLQQKRW